MHSAGGVPYGRVCARKNEENEEMKIKGNKIFIQKRLDVRRPRVTSGTSNCELLTTVLWPSKLASLSRSYAARRRVWRMVGVGMRLLRHDREVEGVVVKDDAVLVLSVRGRARYAMGAHCFRTPHDEGFGAGGGILVQNGISWNHKSGRAQLVCIRSFFSKYFDIAQH